MANYNLSNSDIIKGGHLMVLVDDNPIAFATSHSLSKTLNTQEVATKDHGDFAAVLPQNITWEVTTENLYSLTSYQDLNDAFNSRSLVDLYFGETTYSQTNVQNSLVVQEGSATGVNWLASGFGEVGKAYITSLSVTAAAGENATFSATFTGSGSLSVQTSTNTATNTVTNTLGGQTSTNNI